MYPAMLGTSGAFTGGLPRQRRVSFIELNESLWTPIAQVSPGPKGWGLKSSSTAVGAGAKAGAGAGAGAKAGAGAGGDGGRRRRRRGEGGRKTVMAMTTTTTSPPLERSSAAAAAREQLCDVRRWQPWRVEKKKKRPGGSIYSERPECETTGGIQKGARLRRGQRAAIAIPERER